MPERPRGRDPNRHNNPEKKPQLPAFARAVYYPDERTSEQPYDQTKALIHDHNCNLSAFRVLRNIEQDFLWHIALIGDTPPPQLLPLLDQTLATGKVTTLTDEELMLLYARRLELTANDTTGWVEKSHRKRRRI
jgi:hypothetical protein